jgi:exopolysaccharide biosynthesis polyprenyl glycosylphosphotransferase
VERAERILETTDPSPDLAGAPTRPPRKRTRLLLWLGEGSWDTLRRRLLALADIQAVAVAALSLALLSPAGLRASAWALAALPVWVIVAKLQGLYDRDHRSLRHLTVDELPPLAVWATAGTVSTALVLAAAGHQLGLGAGVSAWAVGTGCAFTLRGAARTLWRRLAPAERILLVGDSPFARAVQRKLELFPDIHARVVAVRRTLPLEGLAEELDGVDRVIFATSSTDESLPGALLAACRRRQLKLNAVPPGAAMFGGAVELAFVADLPLLEYATWGVSRATLLLKRVVDVLAAALGLVVLFPVLVLTALAIRLDSRGRVVFAQTRAGLRGRPFRMYKFRTMVANAEHMLEDVVELGSLREPVFKLRNDPRVTRVGRIIRRTSLDELPQLVNVLRGDMSLVGPRPEQVELVERYTPEVRLRLAVKPGLTGPMQVFGRGELTLEERLAVECDYVENLSLARDLQILLLTLKAVVAGNGAF